ncbi:MAG: YceI family protein [Flavobacteriales bacterium]|nr:YceI family protein [Flavobacteriales bacterium]
MKAKFVLFIAAGLFIASCGSEPEVKKLEPCDCVDLYKGEDQVQKTACDDARKVEAFDEQFRRCMAAAITGRNPEEVNMVKDDEISLTPPADGVYKLDTKGSNVQWKGSKVIGSSHTGLLSFAGGKLSFTDGKLVSGDFSVDMTTLTDTDLPTEERGKLEGHLKSADFFDVENHPTASFQIKSVESVDHKAEFQGTLNIKGKEKVVTGNAVLASTGTNGAVISGTLIFDRTDFDVRYGSSKFFDVVGDKVISDEIMITFKVKALQQN